MKTFHELGVSNDFIKGLAELNIESPTEIQAKAIPFLLTKGTDFIGQAQTGTGKTAAFGLPLLHAVDPENNNVQALVLCPTRELGQQIAKQLFRFTKYSAKIFAEAVYGGEKIEFQIHRLKRPTHIVVATPGRLIDLIKRKAVDLSQVKIVVLDEADEMLSMGFKEELDTILTYTKARKHTWLFSATMPTEIKHIIKTYMAPDAYRIQVNKNDLINTSIEHQYTVCTLPEKVDAVVRFLKSQGEGRGIIFCRTKATAQTLAKQLIAKNFATDAMHGDLLQKERDKIMRGFKSNRIQILIATDISARGIDVADLAYVVHYQLPDQLEYYTHRSGRTARAGNKGLSLCFVLSDEVPRIKEIERDLNITIKKVVV